MSTTGPDPTGADPERVRLSWPGESPARPGAVSRPRRAPRPSPPEDEGGPGGVEVDHGAEVVGRDLPRLVRPLPVVEAEAGAGAALRRAVVEAHDRLADRLLQRLRTVREDIDADMSELRSELGALRESVEASADELPLRQIRMSISELRSEIAGLRHALTESPVLAAMAADLAALRDDLADLSGLEVPEVRDTSRSDAIVDELEALRAEMTSLRRRISLRVAAPESDGLTDEQLDRLAEAVADRLRPAPPPRRR